jgi:small subunit ribosomal protein S20
MANIKSAVKRVRQTAKKTKINLARKSAIKTAIKKVHIALQEGADKKNIDALLRDVQSKLARAKGKGVIHANTAARKISRLAQQVAQARA